MPTRDQLHRLMEEVSGMPDGEVSSDKELLALSGWDSLMGSELRLAALERWGIRLEGVRLETCRTVADIEALFGAELVS